MSGVGVLILIKIFAKKSAPQEKSTIHNDLKDNNTPPGSQNPPISTPKKRYCQNCGTPFEPDQNFCNKCGCKLRKTF